MNTRLAAIAILVVAALSYNLTGYPLLDPDEGRNAEVAREMAATGDYLHPRLNGLPYPDKPVVFFAAAAVFVRVLGPTELAVRLPALLFTLATLALLWWTGRRWFGTEAAWIAVIVAGASPLTLGFARTVIMDSALTLFVTAAIVAFVEERPVAGWIALAFGVLTKGPIALALPMMVVIPYVAWQKKARGLLDVVGILAFLAIVLPWVRSMADLAPGFLHHALVTETFLRLTTPALERTGPWWYFGPIIVAGSLPWSVVVLSGIRDLVRRMGGWADGRMVLFLLWVVVPLVFFSLSQSKRPQYVLPLLVPIALMVAALWGRMSGSADGRMAGGRPTAASLGIIGLVLILGHWMIPGLIRGVSPGVAGAIPNTALLLGVICIVCGAAAWAVRGRLESTLLVLSLPVVSIPFVSRTLMREVGRDRSAAELAAAITASSPDNTEVVGIGAYPPSLPFYLGRLIIVATADGRELTSNYLTRSLDTWRRVPGSPLRPVDWWREALHECDRPRAFVARSGDGETRTILSGQLPVIAESRKYVVYGPCGRVDLAAVGLGG